MSGWQEELEDILVILQKESNNKHSTEHPSRAGSKMPCYVNRWKLALYGSHERSNVLQLKKSLANRKPLQKHTKHKRSWIKINGNRKKKPSQPRWSCFKPAPLQSFTFFWFLSLPQLVHQVIGTPETFLLCFVRFCCCFFLLLLHFIQLLL